jgi:DNA-binding MarR family transcriptional regulator
MRRAFEQRLAGMSDLTLAQARALVYLSRHEGIHQVELADLLEVTPITLARLIDHLAEQGLVERRPDPNDRRAYHLFLTPAAAPQLALVREAGKANCAVAMNGLNDQEAALMATFLNKMRDNLASR